MRSDRINQVLNPHLLVPFCRQAQLLTSVVQRPLSSLGVNHHFRIWVLCAEGEPYRLDFSGGYLIQSVPLVAFGALSESRTGISEGGESSQAYKTLTLFALFLTFTACFSTAEVS